MNKKILIVYHGSKHIIDKPTYQGGKESNDYGYGFYCTESKELACEWACPDNTDGYANEYELDLTGLKILDLTKPQYNILNWIALLLRYRIPGGMTPNDEQTRNYLLSNFSVDLSHVDIIMGYRADDSYFSFARDFVRNSITVPQLSKAMELGKLGVQVVLHSKKAFDQIRYVQSYVAASEEYYVKRIARDRQAKEEYLQTTRSMKVANGDLFVMDIIRQGVQNNDPRLQRNLRR